MDNADGNGAGEVGAGVCTGMITKILPEAEGKVGFSGSPVGKALVVCGATLADGFMLVAGEFDCSEGIATLLTYGDLGADG